MNELNVNKNFENKVLENVEFVIIQVYTLPKVCTYVQKIKQRVS